ncbi:MAG: HD domain-containing protein [Verrucomicrobiales bacterium]|nr:HD domain-containing protein [Verrucomicrobiales bacterium]
MNLPLPQDLAALLTQAEVLRQAYLVGGCVRDTLLGLPVKDFDVEVFGIDYETLADGLRSFGRVDLVGRSFGIIKLSLGGAIHDFGIPRRDSKIGPGHRGFEVGFDPELAPRDAARRRDFTINALMYDPRQRKVLDFFGGQADLEARRLRHTSPAFGEDPLRVFRGMQFAARFHLTPDPATVELCRTMVDHAPELAIERVREEWWKWASRSRVPSAGLRFLDATHWIRHFPEIAALRGVPQDPEWHPEGDVFTHTCHCLDALAGLPEWTSAEETDRVVLMFAVLAHDFGKVSCTQHVERDGRMRIISPGHEQASGTFAAAFFERLKLPNAVHSRCLPLVVHHMAHFQEATERAVRRLARRLAPETIEHLCVVMTADAMGRPPRPRQIPPTVDILRRLAAQLKVLEEAPKPILLGRHLLDLGFAPGRQVGHWTAAAFDAQLDGCFHDLEGARRWLFDQVGFPARTRLDHPAAPTSSQSPPADHGEA